MASRGSSWESAPTAPLPAGPYLGNTGPPPEWSGAPSARPRPRRRRWLVRIVTVVVGLVLVVALGIGGLLLVTPSVGDAQARAQALSRQHHAVYPGPAVPSPFAAALVSTEDHRFYSEPGIDM